MKLLTKEIRERLPALYSQDKLPLTDQIVQVKFFTPDTNWAWLATEGQEEDIVVIALREVSTGHTAHLF